MQGNAGLYAVKKRRKPVQKNVRPPPAKTNPSKRHRDRLNVELDHLTGLLPFSEEVRGRLDKLSVLRLSVGYLKVKSYFHVALPRNTRSAPLVSANGRNGPPVSSLDGVAFSEGELLLQALNGFVLVVTADGTIFYTSPTIRDFLGFHQSDVVHQSVYDLVHMDDRETFKCQLHFALNPSESGADGHSSGKTLSSSQSLLPQHIPPENSSFLERSFCCRLRCLLDNTSGFVALNFSGRLKYLHLGNAGAAAPPQLALFAIATPLQSPSVMEIRTKTLIFQTKHRMDFAPVGIDTRGKLVLGYTEVELVTTGSGYQFIHAADMMYCADNHLRMIKTGDSGFTIFRLLTKTGHWLWVQASARIVFKGGRPDFIIARQKALTNEEGEEHLRQRRQQLPFNLATGEGVLYDVSLDVFSVPGPGPAPGTAEPTAEKPLDPASLLGSLRRQDRSVYALPERPGPQLPVLPQTEDANCEAQPSFERAFLDSHALLSVPSQIQTLQKRSVTGDPTSDAMIDSLEQILGDIGDGGMEGIEVEGTELRDWENTLIRMNKEREDAERELNCTLANDVFSYVEEALRRETGGFVAQGLDQTGCHVPNILSVPGEHPGFSNDEPQWQQTMHKSSDMSGFGEQAQWGNLLSDAGNAMGPKGASRSVSHGTPSALTPTQCCNAHHGHTSSLWPPGGSNRHSGNETVSTQSCMTHQPWLPSAPGTHSVHSSRRPCSEATHRGVQHSLNQTGSQQTRVGQEPRGPLVWQQQQQRQQLQQRQQRQQSFHHHRLSHTVGAVNPAARLFHPQTRQSSGSCAYENNEGHTPNAFTVPAGQSGPLPGQAHVLGTTARALPFAGTGVHQGLASGPGSHAGAHAAVGSTGLGHGGDLGALGSGYPAKNTALQSSFFCWNSEAQIPRVSLNGLVDPFAFPARPTGSVNLSHNAGP